MRVLVFGKTGQVAKELARRCPADISAHFLGRDQADLLHPDACAEQIAGTTADAVINAAAWTAVDDAELHATAATVANGTTPGAMAHACAAKGIPFLHISSDYVFDGGGTRPFETNHPTAPLGAYGRSKVVGEEAIRASEAKHLILRTSWVVSAHNANFVKTMLRLGRERQRVSVVADQIGGPTPAATIADALFVAARKLTGGRAGGTYHFSGAPDVSWATFARAIMLAAGLECAIDEIATAQYPTLAARPLNSRLGCSTFLHDFGIARPDWHASLEDIVKELH